MQSTQTIITDDAGTAQQQAACPQLVIHQVAWHELLTLLKSNRLLSNIRGLDEHAVGLLDRMTGEVFLANGADDSSSKDAAPR